MSVIIRMKFRVLGFQSVPQPAILSPKQSDWELLSCPSCPLDSSGIRPPGAPRWAAQRTHPRQASIRGGILSHHDATHHRKAHALAALFGRAGCSTASARRHLKQAIDAVGATEGRSHYEPGHSAHVWESRDSQRCQGGSRRPEEEQRTGTCLPATACPYRVAHTQRQRLSHGRDFTQHTTALRRRNARPRRGLGSRCSAGAPPSSPRSRPAPRPSTAA